MEIINNDKDRNAALATMAKKKAVADTLRERLMWGQQYAIVIQQILDAGGDISIDNVPQDLLKKAAFSFVRFINSFYYSHENKVSAEVTEKLNDWIQIAIEYLGALTVGNLVQTFPIAKEYDGAKYGSKDYFTTIDALKAYDWNKPIGSGKVFNFLWDYENIDLREFAVHYMSVISEMYRKKTGRDAVVEFLDHLLYDDDEPAAKGLPEGWELIGKDKKHE